MHDDIPQGPAAPCAQLDAEPDDAYRLFEAYTSLPPGRRDLQAVATATGYAYGTVANYSAAYRWRQRAAECDAVDELREAYEQRRDTVERRRVRRLLREQSARLDGEASADELIRIGRALAPRGGQSRSPRHPQPRTDDGRFTPDRPRLSVAEQADPDPECACANPNCRAPLSGCPGGFCPSCEALKAAG